MNPALIEEQITLLRQQIDAAGVALRADLLAGADTAARRRAIADLQAQLGKLVTTRADQAAWEHAQHVASVQGRSMELLAEAEQQIAADQRRLILPDMSTQDSILASLEGHTAPAAPQRDTQPSPAIRRKDGSR